MKKIILGMILMVAGLCHAQQPIYNSVTGILSWSISVDTSDQYYGCLGPQGGPPCQYYYNTGHVAISITNKRTGKTVSSDHTVTGGVATASASLAVQPGDIVSYTETNQEYCPAGGVWMGYSGLLGYWEIASTREKVVGTTPNVPTGHNTYTLAAYCGYPIPASSSDYVQGNIVWSLDPIGTVKAFDLDALCYSSTGHQPWSCANIYASEWTIDPGVVPSCTYNP